MGKINAIVDLQGRAASKTKGRAGEIAKAVDGKAGCFLKAGNEKGRCQMGQMMFDMMHLCLEFSLILRFERFLDRRGAANVFDLLPHQSRMRPMGENKKESPPVVHTGLAI